MSGQLLLLAGQVFGYCPLLYTRPADMFSMLNLSQTWIKNSNRREILSPQFSPAGLRVEPTFVVTIGSKFGTWDSNFVVATAGGGQCPQPDMGSLSYYCGQRSVPMNTEHCSTLASYKS